MKKLLLLLMILGVAAWPPSLAHARALTILDFEGFVYESDNTPGVVGFPPSNPGDVLAGCGLITGMSAPLTWSISPHLPTLAPDVLEWYYRQSHATGRDTFILPPSGSPADHAVVEPVSAEDMNLEFLADQPPLH